MCMCSHCEARLELRSYEDQETTRWYKSAAGNLLQAIFCLYNVGSMHRGITAYIVSSM